MNQDFFKKVEAVLAVERLDAYRQMDSAAPDVTLARYLWNMALCEALYSPLQIAEIALRNALHRRLSEHFHTDRWYQRLGEFTPKQEEQVTTAIDTLTRMNKPDTPGRVVAELSFGFWTAFFNHTYARKPLGAKLVSATFAFAPKYERSLKRQDQLWTTIRELRNRVFHHERILHWKDLKAQHADMLNVIGWIGPELKEMARALDRFTTTYDDGLDPWLAKIGHHWPQS
jgi:hypothetical protein